MCFSATASFSSAALLGVIGVLTLSKVHNRKITLFALTPLMFAFQQLMEGIVWITYEHPDLVHIQQLAGYVFLIIANIIWPIWSSYGLYLVEKIPARRVALIITGIIGGLMALVGIWDLIQNGPRIGVTCNHIFYGSSSNFWNPADPYFYLHLVGLAAYTIAVPIPLLISSVRFMWVVGLLFILGWMIAQLFFAYAFGSVWCFFASISSVLIYFIVDRYKPAT